MAQFEEIEKQLLSSYKSALAEESRKICKEIENKFLDIKDKYYHITIFLFGTDLFDIIKSENYINHYFSKDITDEEFYIKCIKHKYNISNFRIIKKSLNTIAKDRLREKDRIKEIIRQKTV